MARTKLPPAKDWRAREIKDWNATTFREYLVEKVHEKYGVKYVTNSIQIESANIKRMYTEYGREVTKKFIDACLKEYRSTNPAYPYPTFLFMFSYMRERVLPGILAAQARETTKVASEQVTQTMEIEEAKAWF